MRRVVLLLAVVLLAPGALGDVIILKDGTRKEGRIVEETPSVVKLEITSGKMKAVLTIPRKDIEEIRKIPIDYSKILPPKEYYEKRILELAPDDAQGHYDLGTFAFEKKLYPEARHCLTKATEIDETFRSRSRDMLYKIGVFRDRECLDALEGALESLSDGRLLTALAALEKFQGAFDDCDLGREPVAQEKLIQKKYPQLIPSYGSSVEAIIQAVQERAARICPTCEGKKIAPCASCQGTGDAQCPTCEGKEKVSCKKCRGKGEVKCSVCKGYGMTEHYEGRKRVRQDCPKCKATGQQVCPDCDEGLTDCEVCKGKGVVKKGCEVCGAKGKVDCPDCQGTGEREPGEKKEEESTPRRRFGDPK